MSFLIGFVVGLVVLDSCHRLSWLCKVSDNGRVMVLFFSFPSAGRGNNGGLAVLDVALLMDTQGMVLLIYRKGHLMVTFKDLVVW